MSKTAADAGLPLGLKGEKVRRDIAMLALTPVNMNLTVTARKVYTVLLYLAQRSTKNGEGGYSAPAMSIVRGCGANVKMAGVILDYLQQMTSTNVIFRPVSDSEQYSLLGDRESRPETEDEVRVFALLAEARVAKRGGDNWVTWWYPPTIEQQVIDPNRWAVIELDVLAMLTTYTAVALYEIVARYRDSPGQLTPKRPADFWVPILRGKSTAKDREWRKFKAEFVMPAIEQINASSDLQVGLIEEKYGGRKIIDVQFSVVKKPRSAPPTGNAVDVSLVMKGHVFGIREVELDGLVREYGEERLNRALVQLEARVANRTLDPVGKPVAYVRRLLDGLVQSEVTPKNQPSADDAMSQTSRSINQAELTSKLFTEFSQRRYANAAASFAALSETDRAEWMDRLSESLIGSPAFARTVRRLKERDWKSPIAHGHLMRFYAQQALGDGWADPTEEQLIALKSELSQL
ncbi:MAG: hypothetical protein ABI330_10360 [Caldimonas sp.]